MEGVPRLEGLALARHRLDRSTEARSDPDWVAARWADPRARVLSFADGKVAIDESGTALAFLSPTEVDDSAERYFLGLDEDGVPFFAIRTGEAPGDHLAGLREVGSLLPDRDAGLFVHAQALANWHTSHGFCARCGAATETPPAGNLRKCPACGTEHFPRTDPAIIVLVTDDEDRCLLGHQPTWPPGRFSTLAGFVEPGESLEAAVVREVHEETGVVVADPEYAGSQPWPFPSSLMLGYYARAVETEIDVDGEEITEARWYSREEMVAAIDAGELLLPGQVSIARRLIETWYGGELPGNW